MPLVAGEDVRTPLGAFRVVFGIGHFRETNLTTKLALDNQPDEIVSEITRNHEGD
jgi:hypothetical protein